MGKLFLFIILLTGYISAQQVEPMIHDTTAGGAYLPSGIKYLGTKNNTQYSKMPVMGTVSTTADPIALSYIHPANKFGGTNGLKTITTVDSSVVYTGVTTWQRTSIVALDTVEFSYTRAFTVKQLLLPYEVWTDPLPISIASATKLYIRSYGSSTSRKVKISYIGY